MYGLIPINAKHAKRLKKIAYQLFWTKVKVTAHILEKFVITLLADFNIISHNCHDNILYKCFIQLSLFRGQSQGQGHSFIPGKSLFMD